MSFEIVSFEKKQINRGMFKTEMVDAAVAHIKVEDGSSIFASRFSDECDWVVDALISSNGRPVFSNGEGSRVTTLRIIGEQSIVSELDALNK